MKINRSSSFLIKKLPHFKKEFLPYFFLQSDKMYHIKKPVLDKLEE